MFRSPDRSQVGAVSIMSWATPGPESASQAITSSGQQSGCEIESSGAWNGVKTYRTKKKDQLKFLYSNPVHKVHMNILCYHDSQSSHYTVLVNLSDVIHYACKQVFDLE